MCVIIQVYLKKKKESLTSLIFSTIIFIEINIYIKYTFYHMFLLYLCHTRLYLFCLYLFGFVTLNSVGMFHYRALLTSWCLKTFKGIFLYFLSSLSWLHWSGEIRMLLESPQKNVVWPETEHFCGFVNFVYYKTFGQWIFMCASFFPGRVWVQPSLPRFNTAPGKGSNIQMFGKELMEGGRRKISFLSLSAATVCLWTQLLLLDLTFPKQVKTSWYSIRHD